MIFLLLWVTHCNWKWMVRVTVCAEERKMFLCVKEVVLCPCLPYRETMRRKLSTVTKAACSSKDKTPRNTASVLIRKERYWVLRILTMLSDCQSFHFIRQCVYGSSLCINKVILLVIDSLCSTVLLLFFCLA